MKRLPILEDDDLSMDRVGSWVREKYQRVWMYQQIFAESMKDAWEGPKVYIDLFSSSGSVKIRRWRTIHPGSPLLAMRTDPPFDRYIFCDVDEDKLTTLKKRAYREAERKDISTESIFTIQGDVNDEATVQRIISRIPDDSLSLCFADPYNCELNFETIRKLADGRRVDFLILLALGMDANLNWSHYLDEDHDRIDKFLGNPEWRERWETVERELTENGEQLSPVTFLAYEYAEGMQQLGYQRSELEDMYLVRSSNKNLPLYYLALFSKEDLAHDFWQDVLEYSEPQRSFV